MIDTARLAASAAARGIVLDDNQLSLLDRYCELLMKKNEVMNLTAITEPFEVEQKHLIDSLMAARGLFGRVADVGTGGGLPGMAIKIFRPEVELVFIEATGKKLDFVRQAAQELGLDCEYVHARAEQLAGDEFFEGFDFVVARAVANMTSLCEWCLPLVRVGGSLVALKGPSAGDELEAAAAELAKHSAQASLESFSLDGGDARTLVRVEKRGHSPRAVKKKKKR